MFFKMEKPEIIQCRGEFVLVVRNKKGKIVERFAEKNLIVNLAKTSLASLIGGTGANKNINTIAFGTNGTAPDVADTAITGAVTKAMGSITFPEFNSVLYSWSLGLAEANGVAIAEF